ncbi:MAG: TonB-dependent receptor [Sphingobacteriales bacterium]|nr:MAG: TonB-dependent receptor [Sphingobacteriales bacterium]
MSSGVIYRRFAITIMISFIFSVVSFAQTTKEKKDSFPEKILDSVVIISRLKQSIIKQLPEVKGTYLFVGKKSEVINLEKADINRVDNNPRQLFSKIPGVFVYETDGSGNQVNIAMRGLDPHRSWEMNVRHNDIMTNSDLYGYPASHFNPPTESIEKIEIVRGSGALQYGAQFGGMVNYITKEADSSKKVSFETQNSAGSYGLYSTYNAAGGKIKRLQYYAYVNYRKSDGYRDNSDYKYFASHLHLVYAFSSKIKLRAEYNFMDYRNHINGGLTDKQFYENPRQSTRNRNYYSPIIHVPSVKLDYEINNNTTINFVSSAILGSRSSVQFIALSTVADTVNKTTNSYNPRQVDIDNYNSYAQELRLRHFYHLFSKKAILVAGVRYINNDLIRKQLGKGTTGSDYDLSLTDPVWGRDLTFKTKNLSVFAENSWTPLPKLSITAGVRFENGDTKMRGTIKNYNPGELPVNIAHHFMLWGFGSQYNINNNINVFANWAQAYRPVIFADIIPTTSFNKVDKKIKDAFGYNAEGGIRGKVKNFMHFDITLFYLNYHNRTGNIVLTDNNNQAYFYKTNTGNSHSKGAEVYVEVQPIKWITSYKTKWQLSVYSSTAYINAKYSKGTVVAGNINKDITGNRVEVSPEWISRNGVQVSYRGFSTTVQYSFTGSAFSDALNTVQPNSSGTVGKVPAYQLADWNFTYRFSKYYNIKLLVNNVFNKHYFTERPAFFPGPGGLYPSDGRTVLLSLGATF